MMGQNSQSILVKSMPSGIKNTNNDTNIVKGLPLPRPEPADKAGPRLYGSGQPHNRKDNLLFGKERQR